MVGGSGTVAGGWSADVPVANSAVIHDYDEEGGTTVTLETPTAVASTAVRGDIDVILRFLGEFGGVSMSFVEVGIWVGLVGYIQCRFA